MMEEPMHKVVVFLDPDEFHSTWLGNKSIYRTRMVCSFHCIPVQPASDLQPTAYYPKAAVTVALVAGTVTAVTAAAPGLRPLSSRAPTLPPTHPTQ